MLLLEMNQTEIAAKLHVSGPTINGDVKALRAAWRAEAAERTAHERELELAKLARDEHALRVRLDKLRAIDLTRDAVQVYDRVAKIMERRSKILGLEQPLRVDVLAGIDTRNEHQVFLVDHDMLRRLTPEAREAAIESARQALAVAVASADLLPEPVADEGADDVE